MSFQFFGIRWTWLHAQIEDATPGQAAYIAWQPPDLALDLLAEANVVAHGSASRAASNSSSDV